MPGAREETRYGNRRIQIDIQIKAVTNNKNQLGTAYQVTSSKL